MAKLNCFKCAGTGEIWRYKNLLGGGFGKRQVIKCSKCKGKGWYEYKVKGGLYTA